MKTIYLTAGHQVINGKGNGAFGIVETSGKQFDEAIETRKLTDDVIKHLNKWYPDLIVKTDAKDTPLQTVINWITGNAKKGDLAVEFHFDAASPAANGVGAFIPNEHTADEVNFGTKLSFAIANAMGRACRPVRTEKDTAHKSIGILNKPKAATNILIEVCFLTNSLDVNAYRKNYYKVVQVTSDTIAEFIKENN